MWVEVVSERLQYRFDLKYKVTIIRGESGRGKSEFTRALGRNPGVVKRSCEDKRYIPWVITSATWEEDLRDRVENVKRRSVFVIDDEEFVSSAEFANIVINDTRNFYIIIDRFTEMSVTALNQIPFAVDAVYNICTSGRQHWLEPAYRYDSIMHSEYDVVITEDSGAGLDFLHAYNTEVSSSYGKDRVIGFFDYNKDKLINKRVFLFIDMAGCGATFDLMLEAISEMGIDVSIHPDYASFEYCLLCSNFFKFDFSDITLEDIVAHISYERLYSAVISKLTEGKPYEYNAENNKGKLSVCYYIDCCGKKRNIPCDRGIKGNKLDIMFKGTCFDKLFQIIRRSNLEFLSFPRR